MELIKSISIENIVQQRNAIIERLNQIKGFANECQQMKLPVSVVDLFNIHASNGHKWNWFDDDGMAKITKLIDAKLWSYLMEQSGNLTFMDSKAKEEWNDKVHYTFNVPELTIENIYETFLMIHNSRKDFTERGIIEIFRRLSWDYKTNLPVKFGKRIIINYFSDYWKDYETYRFGMRPCNELDDLIRFFSILDGKPEPDSRNNYYNRLTRHFEQTKSTSYEDDFLHLKWYKKRSCHVVFLRPDLVEKMNKIIAKHHPNALPHKD